MGIHEIELGKNDKISFSGDKLYERDIVLLRSKAKRLVPVLVSLIVIACQEGSASWTDTTIQNEATYKNGDRVCVNCGHLGVRCLTTHDLGKEVCRYAYLALSDESKGFESIREAWIIND